MATFGEFDAMRHAFALAAEPENRRGPNPRVGCVVIDSAGTVVGEGSHRGIGSPHAEVVALAAAGDAARGATAIVTLEPCSHTGTTGPCTQALIDAGVRRVVYAQTDPNPLAAGGAQVLADAGIDVEGDVLAHLAERINPEWTVAVTTDRPFVTLKIAATLDGRVAASDGSSQWISGPAARKYVHQLRSEADAVLVGTGTAIADNPSLNDRRSESSHQPRPVVLGRRDVPADSSLRSNPDTIWLRTNDLSEALTDLFEQGIRHVLVEGGPTIATALIEADLVDRLIWFVSPKLLGAGASAISQLGISSVDAVLEWTIGDVKTVGEDVCLVMSRKEYVPEQISEII